MPAPAQRRIAVVVVQGVGDQTAAESITQVGEALVGTGGYRWAPAPSTLPVTVPAARGGRPARHDAERRRLHAGAPGGDRIDLIAMRWSDLSRFPGGSLLAFVASAFGLGVQLGTVGLEATPPGASRAARTAWWVTWLAIAAAAAALLVTGFARGGIAPWIVLVASVAAAAALAAVLAWSRATLQGTANRLMETASWWVAALVIPVTVISALAGTALWLVVDDPLGIPDALAMVVVAVAGVFTMRALGAGIAAGGWSYGAGAGVGRIVDPRGIAMVLLAASSLLAAWRVTETGSLAAGLGQTTLIVGGYAVRPAWMAALALVAVALLALGAAQLRGRRSGRRAAFTRVATTVLGPLVVALVGTILIAGIGAVAFRSAGDAGWDGAATELRCLTGPAEWAWSTDCGDAGAGWPRTALAVEDLRAGAERLDARAAAERAAYVGGGGGTPEAGAAARAAADDLRRQGRALERAAGADPTAWATDVFGIVMLPLVPIALVAGAGALLVAMLVVARGSAGEPPGSRLTDALSLLTGPAATAVLIAAGVGAAVVGWTTWLLEPAETSGGGPGGVWAWVSVLVLAVLALGRLLPVDPRGFRAPVGGGLERARKAIDIPYDVATYLRIDRDGEGIRSRVVARYRALLRAIEGDYDHVVIAAHSQGTMYTLATIAGDDARAEPEDSSGWGVRPWALVHPGSALTRDGVSLLTFGCPIRQTYEERLPGQYAWTGGPDAALGVRLGLVAGAWVNAYRPRDYVGRAVFHPPGEATANRQGHGRRRTVAVPGRSARVDCVDVCLHGGGRHTGYFGDPELALWLDYLIRRSADPAAAAPDPARYAIVPPLP